MASSHPYFGEDTLLGNLIAVAQANRFAYEVSNSLEGREYLEDLCLLYEFGGGILPEVTYNFRRQCEAERYRFEYAGNLAALIMATSGHNQPICLFNHLNSFTHSHIFILENPADLLKLFQQAQPCDYFMSDTSGTFMLAANWHSFTYTAS